MADENEKNDERIVRVQVPVPESLRNSFKSATAANGVSMTDVIVECMEDYVKREKSRQK